MKYEAVIFDVDGTLLDTAEGVLASVSYAIEKCGLLPLSEEQMLTFIGPPIQKSLANYYELEPSEIQKIADVFRAHYSEVDLLKARPYDGIYHVFDVLKEHKIKLAIATYKREDYALRLLKHFGFDRYTSVIYGADNANKLKKKDIIQKCMVDLQIQDVAKIVMVGDSDNDAIGAQELGIQFIGVTYGFDFKTCEDVRKFPSIGCASQTEDIIGMMVGGDKSENQGF